MPWRTSSARKRRSRRLFISPRPRRDRASRGGGRGDPRGGGGNDAPAPGRRPMAGECPPARGKGGGGGAPVLGERPGRPRRKDPRGGGVQPARAKGAMTRRAA